MSQLSLLGPTPTPADLRTRSARWLDRVREATREAYRDRVITADHVRELIDARPELAIPDGVHPNTLGRFFSGWECAERAGGYVRSERPDAHGNLLATWRIL